jgi:hypothetical protein
MSKLIVFYVSHVVFYEALVARNHSYLRHDCVGGSVGSLLVRGRLRDGASASLAARGRFRWAATSGRLVELGRFRGDTILHISSEP